MEATATLSRGLQRGYVQCLACEHWCALAPGETGKCGVRRNVAGKVRLLVYGRAVAAHVDPVEKKPLHHFLPGRAIFSIGTVGCNLRCAWCQNWTISQWRDFDPDVDPIGRHLSPEEIVDTCLARGLPLIAFTYNEPAVFFEYAYDTARLAHHHGIRTVFVSSGFETLHALETIGPYLDAINVDLKAFRETTYRDFCGARLAPVLRNIEHLVKQTAIWTEVTTLIISGVNDSDAELQEIAAFLAALSRDIPWHVTAFTPQYRMTDRPPTSATTLLRAAAIGRDAGLRYVYTGNIWGDPRLQPTMDTCCPHCDALLIHRAGYRVHVQWREPGICHQCGAHIAGVWTNRHATVDQTPAHHSSTHFNMARRGGSSMNEKQGSARIRPAAAAGRFYPPDTAKLRATVREHLQRASIAALADVRALVAPHAGYICSGDVAGYAFRTLSIPGALTRQPDDGETVTVFLLGPAHWSAVEGVALTSFTHMATPLGDVPVDLESSAALLAMGAPFRVDDAVHRPEHALEVELPFLQSVLPRFRVVPILMQEVGCATEVGTALASLLERGGPALVVVSSDLSHYHPDHIAQARDATLLHALVSRDMRTVRQGEACGLAAILALMMVATRFGWDGHLLAYGNSGETCSNRDAVVGYGAVAYTAPQQAGMRLN